jgi:tetratricopeptide (TPR) repeat protein
MVRQGAGDISTVVPTVETDEAAAERTEPVSYRALERGDVIAVGGNATISAAVGPEGEQLALKQPHEGVADEQSVRERFAREATAWTRVDDHPNVVTVRGHGTEPRPWLALERIEGGTLADADPAPAETLWLGARLADALASAHAAGVAHLDVTPDNVLLRATPGEQWPVPALTDWGVAALLERQAANLEGLAPRYAAPEQLAPDRVDGAGPGPQADVYALGTVLYELLTGQLPYQAASTRLPQPDRAAPEPPTGVDPSLPTSVDAPLGALLAPDPADRPTAAAAARMLADALATETGYEATLLAAEAEPAPDLTAPADSPADIYQRAAALEAQGFLQLTPGYFARREPVPMLAAWRRGLNLVDVRAGHAIPRSPPADAETADTFAEYLGDALRMGTNHVLLGPPGAGKSVICRRVACAWFEADHGPVFYRESGGVPFDEAAPLVQALAAADGHALVVVEDAVRQDATAVFDLLTRVAETPEVSVLLDAREGAWREATPEVDALGERPDPRQQLAVTHVARPDESTLDRFIRAVESALDRSVDGERLRRDVRRSQSAEKHREGDPQPGALFYLIHRLTELARDPSTSNQEVSTLTAAVTTIRTQLADAGETALAVGLAANLVNAAGLEVQPELLYAVAPDDPVAVADAIDLLTGQVLFPREADWTHEAVPYPAVHEVWSATYLRQCLAADEPAERFGRVVQAWRSLTDSDYRERVREHLPGRSGLTDQLDANPEAWSDRILTAVFDLAERRPALAPLIGTEETAAYELPSDDRHRRDRLRLKRGKVHQVAGAYDQAREAYAAVLADAEAAEDAELVRAAHRYLAEAARYAGAYETAVDHAEQSLEAAKAADDRYCQATALQMLGSTAHAQGSLDRAAERLDEALAIYRELGHQTGTARAHNVRGIVAAKRGQLDRATEEFEAAMAGHRAVGDHERAGGLLVNLGAVAEQRGDLDAAKEYCTEALSVLRAAGDQRNEAEALNSLASIESKRGNLDAAADHAQTARELYRELGNEHGAAEAINTLAGVAADRGDHATAAERYRTALEINRDVGDRQGVARDLSNLGMLAAGQGDVETAIERLEAALTAYREVGDQTGEASTLADLGEVTADCGDYAAAGDYLETAAQLFSDIGAEPKELDAIEARARVAVEADNPEAAAAWCERARTRLATTALDDAAERREAVAELHPDG